MLPAHLEGYDLFAALKAWKDDPNPGKHTRRSWEVTSFGRTALHNDVYRVRLNWSLGGQCAGLDKVATSPQEAVWMAVEEFRTLYS